MKKKFFYNAAILGVIAYLTLELLFFISIKFNLLRIPRPSFEIGNVISDYYIKDHPIIGNWHTPNSSFRDLSGCYSVIYRANEMGARDKSRKQRSGNWRAVLLGDSFTEGHGVDVADRLSDILERQTGLEHMNFGASGTGPLQHLLIYKHIAGQFSHDLVIYLLLPFNDFEDNDIEKAKLLHTDEYRPYLIGNYPDYQIEYFNPAALDGFYFKSARKKIKSFTNEFSFTLCAMSYFRKYRRYLRMVAQSEGQAAVGSLYQDFTPPDFLRLRYCLEQLKAAAGDKPVCVITVPVIQDFGHVKEGHSPRLVRQLTGLARELGFIYFDLMPAFAKPTGNIADLYLPCDGHWNGRGQRLAAEIILDRLKVQYPNPAQS